MPEEERSEDFTGLLDGLMMHERTWINSKYLPVNYSKGTRYKLYKDTRLMFVPVEKFIILTTIINVTGV